MNIMLSTKETQKKTEPKSTLFVQHLSLKTSCLHVLIGTYYIIKQYILVATKHNGIKSIFISLIVFLINMIKSISTHNPTDIIVYGMLQWKI